MRRIFLIGFMGSGKTHTGKLLARILQLPFIDLDGYIESQTGRSVTELFAEAGEVRFRELEAAALRDLLRWNAAIIACGGGTPCYHNNMEWMNENGVTVYLETPPEVLARRLAPEMGHRPLLHGQTPETLPDFIAGRLALREPFYRQAGVIYRQTGDSDNPALELAEHLGKITGH